MGPPLLFRNPYSSSYEVILMKGYYTDGDYWGWIPDKNGGGRYMRFVDDTEYREAYEEATAS